MTVAERVLDGMGAAAVTTGGPLLADKLAALCASLEAVDELVGGEDGWSLAFDPERSPWPGWTGQAVGAAVTGGTLAEQRASIDARGTRRGTVPALLAAVKATLTGSKSVMLIERSAGPYALTVQVYDLQMNDEAVTRAAITRALPVGLRFGWTLEVLIGQTWQELKDSGQTFDDLRNQTMEEVRSRVPE